MDEVRGARSADVPILVVGSSREPRREPGARAGRGDLAAEAFCLAAALVRRIGAPAVLARAAIGLSDLGTASTEYGRSDEALIDVLADTLHALGPDNAALRTRVMARLATERLPGQSVCSR